MKCELILSALLTPAELKKETASVDVCPLVELSQSHRLVLVIPDEVEGGQWGT